MYSSDGGTDPSKSNDVDIPISIHSSISSPTVPSQTLLYSIQLPLLLNTKENVETPRTQSNKKNPFLFSSPRPTRTRGLYSVGFESTLKATFKVTLKVRPTLKVLQTS